MLSRMKIHVQRNADPRTGPARRENAPPTPNYDCIDCGRLVKEDFGRPSHKLIRLSTKTCGRCCEDRFRPEPPRWPAAAQSFQQCGACGRTKGRFQYPGWTVEGGTEEGASFCRTCLDETDTEWNNAESWGEYKARKGAQILLDEMEAQEKGTDPPYESLTWSKIMGTCDQRTGPAGGELWSSTHGQDERWACRW